MDDQPDVFRHVVGALESLDVPYMIGGSVALAVWATPRMTHDLDIVIDLPEDRIVAFCSHFSQERYFIDPDVMGEAFRQWDQPSLGMYSFVDMYEGFKVDLFPLRPHDLAQQAALRRRVKVEVLGDLNATVYAPDDLLVQKLRWYAAGQSERQFRDCLNLLLTDLKRPQHLIEWGYVEMWARQLGPDVEQAWFSVKSAAQEAQK